MKSNNICGITGTTWTSGWTAFESVRARYAHLRSLHRRVGRMDLAIAAVVLDSGAVLVTRNRADFDPIEGLAIQDWSRGE